MNTFRERIRTSIANDNLQKALDGNVERRLKGRAAALASIPDYADRRKRAHAIRADVIDHLDQYLDQLIVNLTQNGIIVHRAKDSHEAVEIALKIVNDSPQRTQSSTKEDTQNTLVSLRDLRGEKVLIAKSKSMVSEEIELNHALEKAGHRVVETDLGEYIIQLRGERPSHIITPAVHLRRGDVAKLFEEKLGLPYTEDIPMLTQTARKILREVFLTADIGISGVNFAAAETGTLTLVTNEGNGRMCTTLPKTHIALLGMERLVPTLDDLALFLSLLPRSATGQKLSVYTQLINAPLEGQERHVIIVDNGRSKLRNSSLKEALYCIRCGACLNACPVFREIGGHAYVGKDGSIAPYPGPIGSIISPGLLGMEPFGHLAQASSLCGACKEACPVAIDLPMLLTRVRADQLSVISNQSSVGEGVGLPLFAKFFLKAFSVVASQPKLFGLAQRVMGFVFPNKNWLPLPAITGWGYSKDFPRPSAKPFRLRTQNMNREDAESAKVSSQSQEQLRELRSAAMKDLQDQFEEELATLGGKTIRCSKLDLADQITHALAERAISAIQAWSVDLPDGLAEKLSASGIMIQSDLDPNLKAGLTGVLCAIADTGSILVHSGDGRPLTASLVPVTHLAVAPMSKMLKTLPDALALRDVRECASLAVITGPSRTADIEMTLTIGVHGPGELIIFLVDDL
jgi:L-lactate dehydrogenase complex protein LldF